MLNTRLTGIRSRIALITLQLNREEGLELIEYIGLGAVALAIIGGIVAALDGNTAIGSALVNTIVSWIEALAG